MQHKLREFREKIIELVLAGCASISVLTTAGIVLVLVIESALFFKSVSLFDFLFDTQWTPLFADKHFGILPLLSGTLLIALIAIIFALPAGLILAIYLSEFATERTRNIVKPIIEILAGIPTVVFGYFALLTVTPFLQSFIPGLAGFNALSPGIVCGIMIVPIIASMSEDALFAATRSLREGAYALGASKLQMIFTVLLPAASGGVIASVILAVSRAVGETMIVAIAAGQQPVLTANPLDAVETMTAYIVQVSLGDTPHGTLEYHTIFAVAAALFLITLLLNSISIWIREKFYVQAS